MQQLLAAVTASEGLPTVSLFHEVASDSTASCAVSQPLVAEKQIATFRSFY
jgi:hypothetical protein